MTDDGLRHGVPKSARNDKYKFDKYLWPAGGSWPSGLEIHIYDDGRVKVGGWHSSAVVLDVSSYRTGSSNASGHVVVRFQPAAGADAAHVAVSALDTDVHLDAEADLDTDVHLDAEADLDTDDLRDEAAYENACWEAIEECKHLRPRYDPSIWIGMIQRSGATAAARQLLVSPDIQYGFRRLVEAGRPELTVEWSVLLPRWRQLFGEPHREAARWRLQQAGVEPPDNDPDL